MVVTIIIYIFLFHFLATQSSTVHVFNQAGTSVCMLIVINDFYASILSYNTLRKDSVTYVI